MIGHINLNSTPIQVLLRPLSLIMILISPSGHIHHSHKVYLILNLLSLSYLILMRVIIVRDITRGQHLIIEPSSTNLTHSALRQRVLKYLQVGIWIQSGTIAY